MFKIVKIQPAIKWSGSKRGQSETIVSHMPKEINTYYEPFVGGASVLYQLLHSDIKVYNYTCSDFNNDLITLWNYIKNNPDLLSEMYKDRWEYLNSNEDVNIKKQKFYEIRSRFNKDRNPADFLFLSRTCTNGLIRYNSKGEFNTSLHFSRKGIIPETLKEIILNWSEVINANDVEFIHRSYDEVEANEGDFLYLDPPYANTKGMYFGALDYEKFWNWLKAQEGGYLLSFDGKRGSTDNTFDVPDELYSRHIYLHSGRSSFKDLKHQVTEQVYESLYFK